ncbi:MAG: hypothetical protein KAG97_02935 [Victivallales bacterium]|nr:hypothetical protein [Victivallales bacterium]
MTTSKNEMNSRERVLCALAGGVPDQVPFAEQYVGGSIIKKLLNLRDGETHTWSMLADALGNDIVKFAMHPPLYCEYHIADGQSYVGDGKIKSRDDLSMVELPDDEEWIDEARDFLKTQRGDRAAAFATRLGISPTLISMGIDGFSMALYEDRGFVEEIIDRYARFAKRVITIACELGFDLVWCFDDFAYKTGTMFSPTVFDDLFIPAIQPAVDAIELPWIFHSDGNLYKVLDSLLGLGMSAIHPVEPEAMDLKEFKETVNKRACVIGNISVNLLASGTPKQIRAAVIAAMEKGAPGGGYMISSGNCIPDYARIENVKAMISAIADFKNKQY